MYKVSLQKTLGVWITSCMAVGFCIILIGLFMQAGQLASLEETASRTLAIGPFTLITILKQQLNGGFQASFEIQPGIIGYSLAWLVLGCAGAFLVHAFRSRSTS